MIRFSTLVWMLVIVVASFFLYTVKYEVQSLRRQVAETSRELEAEKEALHVVAAEWAYLNRPERLETLAGRYLAETDVSPAQIADITDIPMPGQEPEDEEDGVRPVSMRSMQ